VSVKIETENYPIIDDLTSPSAKPAITMVAWGTLFANGKSLGQRAIAWDAKKTVSSRRTIGLKEYEPPLLVHHEEWGFGSAKATHGPKKGSSLFPPPSRQGPISQLPTLDRFLTLHCSDKLQTGVNGNE